MRSTLAAGFQLFLPELSRPGATVTGFPGFPLPAFAGTLRTGRPFDFRAERPLVARGRNVCRRRDSHPDTRIMIGAREVRFGLVEPDAVSLYDAEGDHIC